MGCDASSCLLHSAGPLWWLYGMIVQKKAMAAFRFCSVVAVCRWLVFDMSCTAFLGQTWEQLSRVSIQQVPVWGVATPSLEAGFP